MAKKFVINIIKNKKRIASIIYENGGYYDEAMGYMTDLSNVVLTAESEQADVFAAIYHHLVDNGGGVRKSVMDKIGFNKLLPGEECVYGDIKYGLMTTYDGGFESYDVCKSYADINLDTHTIEHNVLPNEMQAQLMEEDDIDPFHFSCETSQTLYEYAQSVYNS